MGIKKITFFILTFLGVRFIQTVSSDNQQYFNNNGSGDVKKLIYEENGYIISAVSQFFYNLSSENVSNRCKESLYAYFNGLNQLEPWALEMLDASGKFPSSFLSGTMIDFGSLDDCVRIKSESKGQLHQGQFCMLSLQQHLFQPTKFATHNDKSYVEAFGVPPDWIRHILENYMSMRFGLYLGICVPSACTENDIYHIINTFAQPFDLNITITDCQIDEPTKWSTSAKLIIVFLAALLLLCTSGTALDLFDRKKKGTNLPQQSNESLNLQIVKSFSIYRNVENLLTVDKRNSRLDCIYGLRFFLCCVIFTGHILIFPSLWKELRYKNFYHVYEMLTPEILFVNNGATFVEGFIYLSAFLLAYTSWRKLEKSGGKMDIWDNIVQKYWRLTPTPVFIALFSFLMPVLSSGPIWNSTWGSEYESCFRNGWKNLLYIQNNDNILDLCWSHTWYLAVSLQLIVLSLPLVVATYKFPIAGISLGLFLFFGSIANDFKTSIENQCPFFAFNGLRYIHLAVKFSTIIYTKLCFHIPSNLVGLLAGWFVLKYGDQKFKKVWLITGWITCIACFLISLYAVYLPTEDLRITALYNSTRNTLFCVGLSWLVFVCASGQGGVVDKLLSWKGFVPVSRMSYSIFLVHPLILVARDASLTERYYMDKIFHAVEGLPYLALTFIVSFIVYITVEEPCNTVYDLLRKRNYSVSKTHQLPKESIENGHRTKSS